VQKVKSTIKPHLPMKKQWNFAFLLFCMLCLSIPNLSFAQQSQITGKVTDADSGEGIPGVSVLVKGTTRGAITDLDGNYTIAAAAEEILVFSFI
jgi:iron complex outermembrane receptor protein